jgi:methionyl aminopeptidase
LSNITIKTPEEIEVMRQSGIISAKALKKTITAVKPGVSLHTLEKIATDEIERLGAKSAFKTVPGYHWTTCLTINEEVVHGIPRDITLQEDDILSIDLGALLQGWYTDTAWSVVVGGGESDFLKIGEQALWTAVDQAVEGNTIGHISEAIQKTIEAKGYSVVRTLIGHGVGKALHEAPEVPGYGKAGDGPLLKSGMTLAIEVIYTSGGPEVVLADDNWTIVTQDGSLGGLFEMTVVVGKESAEVLTDWRGVKD